MPDGSTRSVVLPMHAGDLPAGTLYAILRSAGMTIEDLRRLLKS